MRERKDIAAVLCIWSASVSLVMLGLFGLFVVTVETSREVALWGYCAITLCLILSILIYAELIKDE